MKKQSDETLIFTQDSKIRAVLDEVCDSIPKHTQVYLFGGVVRNAIYYHFFHERLPQRDYDIIVIGDYKKFIKNLKTHDFVSGKKTRFKTKISLKKKIGHNKKIAFYVYLDIVVRDKGSIRTLLNQRANFTFNGFALSIRDYNRTDWFKKIVAIPGALRDIRLKRIRLHAVHPIDIYACLRFVSLGFQPPSQKEIQQMVTALRQIEKWRFSRDTKKVIQYVGSKARVEKIAKQIGVPIDIFDFSLIKHGDA